MLGEDWHLRCVYQAHQVLSVVPDESQGRVVVRLGDQGAFPASLDASEIHRGYGITRAAIVDYLTETYGPVFVEDLLKHLAPSCEARKLDAVS